MGVPGKLLARSLETLRRERLVHQASVAGRRPLYTLTSTSARQILSQQLAAADRRRLHDRAGALLEKHCQSLEERLSRQLAYQYLRAGNREKGALYGVEAARQLARDGSIQEAIDTYDQVLALAFDDDAELLETVPQEVAALKFQAGDYAGVVEVLEPLLALEEREGGREGASRAAVLLQAASARLRLGDFREARSLLERPALERSETRSPSEAVSESTETSRISGSSEVPEAEPGSAADRARALLVWAEFHAYRGDPVESLRFCNRLLKNENLEKDPAVMAELHMLLAENHAVLDDKEGAAGHCQLALRLINPEQGASLLALSLFCRGNYYRHQDRLPMAIRQFHLSLVLHQKLGALDRQADCLSKLGLLYLLLGRPQKARPHLRQAVALYGQTGNRPRRVEALSLLGEAHALLGESEQGLKALGDSGRRSADLVSPYLPMRIHLSYAGLALDRGDLENAGRYLFEARSAERPGALTSRESVRAFALESRLAYYRGELSAALEHAVKGLRIAREINDAVGAAQLLTQRAFLLTYLGKIPEARRELVNLLDTATRHGLLVSEGWARLLEAALFIQEERFDKAKKTLAPAAERLMGDGGERDLVHLYLQHGLFSLQAGDHEQAYLDLEEGLYLAKKLALDHDQCRYHLAIGALESQIAGGDTIRSLKPLLMAQALAGRAPYPELLWQVHYQLGKLALLKDPEEAQGHFRTATTNLSLVLDALPNYLRRSYVQVVPAYDLLDRVRELEHEPQCVEEVVP
jgi:tetratricopeptide (TPR) repeat protein